MRQISTELPTAGIGHTRWATHGGVTDANAHPHRAGKVTLIHNGIIENYHELTEQFHLEGQLVSQTDSEVAARVLDALYDGDPLKAIQKLQELIVGSYGFCILFDDQPGSVYAIRRVSPLVASYTHGRRNHCIGFNCTDSLQQSVFCCAGR